MYIHSAACQFEMGENRTLSPHQELNQRVQQGSFYGSSESFIHDFFVDNGDHQHLSQSRPAIR
jgi:hypothetical protein